MGLWAGMGGIHGLNYLVLCQGPIINLELIYHPFKKITRIITSTGADQESGGITANRPGLGPGKDLNPVLVKDLAAAIIGNCHMSPLPLSYGKGSSPTPIPVGPPCIVDISI